MPELPEYMKIITSLIAIVNPVGAIPFFVSLTHSYSAKDRGRTINTVTLTVLIVLTVVMFCGEPLLNFFGVSIASFRAGGGILILLMALSMLQAKQPATKQTREESLEAEHKRSIAVVPLGIPLLAGPGAISAVILHANHKPSAQKFFFLFLAIIIVTLVVSITLRLAPKIDLLLGKTGINIVTRIMGLIMTAIGIEFIAQGLSVLLPGLN